MTKPSLSPASFSDSQKLALKPKARALWSTVGGAEWPLLGVWGDVPLVTDKHPHQLDSSSSPCFPYMDLEAIVPLNWVLSDIIACGQIDFSIQVSCLQREEVK